MIPVLKYTGCVVMISVSCKQFEPMTGSDNQAVEQPAEAASVAPDRAIVHSHSTSTSGFCIVFSRLDALGLRANALGVTKLFSNGRVSVSSPAREFTARPASELPILSNRSLKRDITSSSSPRPSPPQQTRPHLDPTAASTPRPSGPREHTSPPRPAGFRCRTRRP